MLIRIWKFFHIVQAFITAIRNQSFTEYMDHFYNMEKDEVREIYKYYKKQLQLLAYKQGCNNVYSQNNIILLWS